MTADRSLPSPGPTVRWALVGLVATVALVASVVDPGGAVPGVAEAAGSHSVLGVDKAYHFAGYAILGATLAYALAPRGATLPLVAGVVLGVASFGFSIELVQATLPYRAFDLVDAAANALGGLVAAVAWWVIDARRGRDGG